MDDVREELRAVSPRRVGCGTRGNPTRRSLGKVRTWLRALHRDAGYLAVGLTVVYALSGLAVNHIADWDPNFEHTEEIQPLRGVLPRDDAAAARAVLRQLQIDERPTAVYRASDTQLEITLPHGAVHVDTERRELVHEGQRDRLLLRAANWLHLNRGKKAWTIFADGYAVLLLFLAGSGMFMLPGTKGLIGRGGVLVAAGIAVPVLYVTLSGGP
jgi:hypothetical protein